ncbi:prenyltransferase/squalene oxidase repeat-containing protein [Prosthecobacter sp.]|uniref:prenyltransferase/squalene oxidase repeat-containing protein n=1 Tax=Prosthecobacter sp. TaxID=1965333 RepID=UPI002ABA61A2|nr:prenyltransferase/squalene oxidase repeat-containing protein [Prosthecobacter sp.]MDZ4403851.1 prenyltransferase/squalene oxidase repeat-containing protein [Prosthecobacter sp.]
MKLPAFLLILATASAFPQAATQAPRHESLKQELRLGVERGLNFLRAKQNQQTGQWGEAEPVAITGLAMTAFMLDPNRKPGDPVPAEVEKATRYLISNAKPDGSISIKARATYNTAIALTALLLNNKPENEEVMLKARRYLVTRQLDLDEKGKQDNPTDGGIGYGEEKATHADLSNTTFALEALYYAQSLLADKGDAAKGEPQLNFGAAIDFIQRCQNRPESNKSSWVSKDPKDAGGFIYNPTETRGAKVENPDGTISLRSYGSISYAGLLSFIYAGLDKSDPRVKAVIEWISANYSADENPGLGAQGLYYYYHTLSKALSIAQIDFIKTKDGKLIDWRADITQKLLNLQKGDGSWANSEGRWMESDPVLTTSYILMALGRIHQTL